MEQTEWKKRRVLDEELWPANASTVGTTDNATPKIPGSGREIWVNQS